MPKLKAQVIQDEVRDWVKSVNAEKIEESVHDWVESKGNRNKKPVLA